MKLGKLAPRRDARTLKLARYLTPALPPAPASVDWSTKAAPAWGMMLNDQLGDCTCAAIGHATQLWTSANGVEVTPTDADVQTVYEKACGYNPADPATDQGGVEIEVLNYWRKTGIGGHKIAAFAALQPENIEHVKQSINLFGLCYIGLALPKTIQGQAVWAVDLAAGADAMPGSLGGHAVVVVAYDAIGLTCITWGAPQRMTWAFWDAYCDESYAPLSSDWAQPGRVAPVGFDLAALHADLGGVA